MKKTVIIIMMIFFLTGCAQPDSEDSEELSYYPESCRQYAEESGYVPLNYTKQVGIWLPYMRFDELLKGKSEDEYRSNPKAHKRRAQRTEAQASGIGSRGAPPPLRGDGRGQ